MEVDGTGSVKIWKTRHNISVDEPIFFTVYSHPAGRVWLDLASRRAILAFCIYIIHVMQCDGDTLYWLGDVPQSLLDNLFPFVVSTHCPSVLVQF